MNRKEKFNRFLKSLKDSNNQSLIESIHKGFQSIFEDRETDAILDIMNMYNIPWDEAKEKYQKIKEPEKNSPPQGPFEKLIIDRDSILDRRMREEEQFQKESPGLAGINDAFKNFLSNKHKVNEKYDNYLDEVKKIFKDEYDIDYTKFMGPEIITAFKKGKTPKEFVEYIIKAK